MELLPGSKRKAVGELLTQLLSRDAVEFNSCINANFSSNVAYTGHNLKFEGSSNLKHASWLFNALVSGQPATFDLKDIEWDEQSNAATVHTLRYVRPRFLPLFGFTVPVETHLRFHADGSDAGQSASQTKLYVTKFEEHWPTDVLATQIPVLSALVSTFFTPIATFFWLALSNIAFAVYARATSSKRQYLDTSVGTVSGGVGKVLPAEVAQNVNSGFVQGSRLAQGWADSILRLAGNASYPLLSTVELVCQKSISIVPVSLPYPYIYDAHSHPSGRAAKQFTTGKKNLSAPREPSAPKGVPASEAESTPPSQDRTAKEGSDKAAAVQVGPSIGGVDQGKTVDIPHRANNEAKEEAAAPVAKPSEASSLYDQLRKDGELPSAEETAKKAALSSGDNGNAANGSTNGATKKKSGNKKKKGPVHPPAPSFKEGLEHAEEQDIHPYSVQ